MAHRDSSNARHAFAWIDFGPRASIVVVTVLVLQTLIFDPSAYLKIEIASQIQSEALMSASKKDYNADANGFMWFEPGFKIFETQETGFSKEPIEKSYLFRPSLLSPFTKTISACAPLTTNDAVLTDFSESALVNISKFIVKDEKPLIVRGDKNSKDRPYATCRFINYQFSHHFQHTAQQLFRCWSFWSIHRDKTPVLATTEADHWKLTMEEEFNRGLVDSFEKLGVEIRNSSHLSFPHTNFKDTESISARAIGPILNRFGDHYQTASVNDAQSLREGVMSSLDITLPESRCNETSRLPRIAIMNRRKSRKIGNTKPIIEELTRHFNLSYNIPIGFFEDVPFRNQIGMMASTDILITPHGAQETGIAFMPQCGEVLEILPEQYYFPRVFGTLAASAGIGHSFIHLAQNATDHTMDVKNLNLEFLCPSIDHIRDAVATLVERWRRCCDMYTE